MIISPANLSFFFTTLETRFWQAYSVAPTFYDKVCTTYPAGSEQMIFGWENMLDKVREWVGPRVVQTPALQTYTVPMQLFETTKSIDKFKLADDQYGLYFPTVQNIGMQTKKWPDYQVRDLLQNSGSQTGVRQLGTDGLTHWNTAHPVDFYDASKGTYCNDFRGGGVSVNGVFVGGALSNNAFATLWEEIASRKGENGESLGLMADMTSVAPQLAYTAKTLLQAQFFAPSSIGNLTGQVGAAENMLKNWTDLMVVPEFAPKPTEWYQLVCNRPVKPFSWCLREAPNFVIRNRPDDPAVFDSHTYLYGSEMRGAPAWGLPFLSAISGS